MVSLGIFPSKKNFNGKIGDETWDLMISSEEFRPQDPKADLSIKHNLLIFLHSGLLFSFFSELYLHVS